jgi:hypothetical protein
MPSKHIISPRVNNDVAVIEVGKAGVVLLGHISL